MPDTIAQQLLERNKKWVSEQVASDPDYFKNLAKGQHPHTLWIGCADSRVPANVITGSRSGDLFVHRNIANVVVHDDLNMLSVLEYAVLHLEVEHVIVCGHYGCGGVKAALGHQNLGLINKWLRFIKDEYWHNKAELEELGEARAIERRMVELNVSAGVRSLGKTSILQKSWAKRNAPIIHGWVYDLEDGLLRDLDCDMVNTDQLDDIYKFDLSGG